VDHALRAAVRHRADPVPDLTKEHRRQNACPATLGRICGGSLRKDFGLTFSAILDGRMVVSEEIQINIEGELVEQPQAAEAVSA
jgi:hypothetical protein